MSSGNINYGPAPSLAQRIVSDYAERLKDLLVGCATCFKADSTLTLNGRKFKIVKLLGEGGFSFVYLAEDETSGRLFALKKIRCPLGSESVREAMKEVEAHRRFRHPNCIRCLDSAVVQEADGKVIYLFLPYYKRGNLQDAINTNATSGSHFSEKEMLDLFLGTCQAVRAMHTYIPGPSSSYPPSSTSTTTLVSPDAQPKSSRSSNKGKGKARATESSEALERAEAEEAEEAAIRASAGASEPLIGSIDRASPSANVDERNASGMPGLGDTSGARLAGRLPIPSPHISAAASAATDGVGQAQPYAHRDIKPANVMITDDGQPILMDFGSALPARIMINNRSQALQWADEAAEHCTMPFRAPELFDPPVGKELTEKVDIWSLGCTLFALAYGKSPFDVEAEGGNVVLAVRGGQYRFPANDRRYSQTFRDLIAFMLVTNPDKRPDIHQVVARTEQALQSV